MSVGISVWWRLRTDREQRLIIVMFALLALVAAWLFVIRPLADALDDAKREHADAVAALAEARTRAGLRPREAPVAVPALPVDTFVSRTAGEAGFAGARIVAQGPRQTNVAIDAARPQAFFGWIGQMERGGLTVESLRARTNPDRTLAVEVVLQARAR